MTRPSNDDWFTPDPIRNATRGPAAAAAREFAQAILGKPEPPVSAPAPEAAGNQQLREWVASITTEHIAPWDPNKHPRGGFPENIGRFSPSGGSGAVIGSTISPKNATTRAVRSWPDEPESTSTGDARRPGDRIELAQAPMPPAAVPGLPAKTFDPDALKRAGIVVLKDPGQPVAANNDGGAQWKVTWDTTIGPPGLHYNKGWIVQRVDVTVQARDAIGGLTPLTRNANGDPVIPRGPITQNYKDNYLEAWRVDASMVGHGGKVRAGENKKLQGADEFIVAPERAGTHGRIIMRCKVLFLDSAKHFPAEDSTDWNWPSRGFPNHIKDPTGVLPSTRNDQQKAEFDKFPNAADHWMIYEWNTLDPDPAKHLHRRYGGLGVPFPPVLGPIP